MNIREATSADADRLWEILEPICRAGETYAIARDIARDELIPYWLSPQHRVFVVETEEGILGTYYLKTNQQGGGAHVCNCAFATHADASGKGIARAMLAHALTTAKERGYRAMQFNFVVSSNARAVETWLRNGFEIVGTLPKAFDHPSLGYVDAYVMFKHLNA